jgi:adenosylcobinamide-phosphate synthase
METALAFIELHSAYLSFMLVALCSFFFSLPKDLNPLSAFAVIFQQIARKVNLDTRSDSYKRLASILSFTIIFSPLALIISQLYIVAFKPLTIDIIILYVLLSWHERMYIYQQISIDLQAKNLPKAKLLLSELTLRDTKPLSQIGTNKAIIESLVLHMANSWFAVVFWYLATDIYGALFYQLMNICAQQWNCKHEKYDVLGKIPSIIVQILQLPVHILLSFTFSLYDRPIRTLFRRFRQSIDWHHFSSGLLLSSFALSLHIQLGGVRMYESDKVAYTNLGMNTPPNVATIDLAIQRIALSAWFWLACITGYEFLPTLIEYFSGASPY